MNNFIMIKIWWVFDDFCRSLVLPSEAKIADGSDRVALHRPLLRNCLVRGDRSSGHVVSQDMDSILDALLLSCGVRSTSLTICEVRTH